MIRHSWSPTCEFLTTIDWNLSLEPLFHLLETHGLTFACNVGLPGVLKKDATAARQRALPWLGWYPLFWPEFTSVTSATASCYPYPWVQQICRKALHEKQQQPFQHWVEGEDSRLDRLCQRYQCLWWVFLRKEVWRWKRLTWVTSAWYKTVKCIQLILLFTMIFGCWPPWKNKRAPLATSEMDQLCGLSRNGIHDLSDGIPDVLGPFTQANAPFRWLLIFSLQTPLPCNDHGHPWWLYR